MSIINVDDWIPNPEDRLIDINGSMVVFPFDVIFNRDLVNENIVNFIIKKDSYVTVFRDSEVVKENGEVEYFRGGCHYLNYLMKFYDHQKEIPVVYFHMKYLIDDKTVKPMNIKAFRKLLYKKLFTPSVQKMIWQMVEDNWHIELHNDTKANYAEHLLFTEEHAKSLMAISLSMKLIIPIMMHYLNTNNIDSRANIYYMYKPLFKMFSNGADIYNKLYITVITRVEKSVNKNPGWGQQEILGREPYSKAQNLLRDHIISEAMVRYIFAKNPVIYNSVFLDKQIRYFLIVDYGKDLIDVDNTKGPEGLSGMDKLEMNSNKIDASIPILSRLNIDHTINKLMKQMKIKTIDAEVEYYREYHRIDKIQVQLVNYYYANIFGGYRDLSMLTRTQYLKLVVLLKRRLQAQGFVYLPQIITGNLTNLNLRVIQNKKFLNKIETSSVYRNLLETKFPALIELGKERLLIGILSSLINSDFTVCDYDSPQHYGEILEIANSDALSDEFLNYLSLL